MNVLVIGKGGREHAIIKALKKSASVTSIHVLPGNSGMENEAICHNLATNDFESLSQLCKQYKFDLCIIGPEQELVDGLADFFRSNKISCFGPSMMGAQLEASKLFAKFFMQQAQIPTAQFEVIESAEECLQKSQKFKPPFVFKVDGLAGGKGVFICKNTVDLEKVCKECFEEKAFGDAGKKALLEEYVDGWEASVFVLTNGKDYEILPLAQDHKRLGDGGTGPNTGGMGVVAPLVISPELKNEIEFKVVKPTVENLSKQNIDYRGVIFIGLMINSTGVSVLEYNVRFGDPETQALLPLLDGDWGKVFKSYADGINMRLNWKSLHTACIVLAAEGYPDKPVLGIPISGDLDFEASNGYFINAGVASTESGFIVNGGRVLNSIGIGTTKEEAIALAYQLSEKVNWPGLQKRNDIGSQFRNEQEFS